MGKSGVLNRALVFSVMMIAGTMLLIVENNAFSGTLEESYSKVGGYTYFDHVHFIVKDLEKALATYEKLLGVKPEDKGGFIKDFPGLGRIGMLPIPGGTPGFRLEMIELAPNVQEDNRMYRFLKERGEGVGGLSIFVEDFDAVVKDLRGKGVDVKVDTISIIDPEYPFRVGWVEAEEAHGAWIELVDSKAVPPFEIDWDLELRGDTSQYFDHVHFIVKNADEATKTYKKLLGLSTEDKGGLIRDSQNGNHMRMLPIPGCRIEMLERGPKVDDRMSRFLKKYGEGVGGLSVFVEDFDALVKDLREKGFTVEVRTGGSLDPKYPPFKTAWVEAEEAHGVWIEYVEAKAVPPYEKKWWHLLID